MGSVKFLLNNRAIGATVLNGTAGTPTPPARSEVTPFVMERALNGDRRSLHKFDAANDVLYFGTDYQLDLDLGAAVGLSAIHIGGLSCPGGVISSMEVGYFTTYPSHSPVLLGNVNFSSGAPRDYTFTFPATNVRYLYVWIAADAAPVLGLVRPDLALDIGAAPNFGSGMVPLGNRSEVVLQDGSVLVNELGDDGADFQLQFNPILNATADLLERARATRGTLIYVDPDGVGYEVFWKGRRMQRTPVGGGCCAVSFELGRCP